LLSELEQDMLKAATNMEFERAAEIRDRIDTVQGDYLSLTKKDFAAKLGKPKIKR
jgi:excinuclease UvrABC nuclease subunit